MRGWENAGERKTKVRVEECENRGAVKKRMSSGGRAGQYAQAGLFFLDGHFNS